MIKKAVIFTLISILLNVNAAQVFAAKSLSKSYKISVNLPENVSMARENSPVSMQTGSQSKHQQVTERIVCTAGPQKILLRTTVVK